MGGLCCGNDNPYLLISRSRGSGLMANEFMKVYRSDITRGNRNPNFGEMKLKTQ